MRCYSRCASRHGGSGLAAGPYQSGSSEHACICSNPRGGTATDASSPHPHRSTKRVGGNQSGDSHSPGVSGCGRSPCNEPERHSEW
eukprot:6214535-Pleurochrysis_carterae.AAC.2